MGVDGFRRVVDDDLVADEEDGLGPGVAFAVMGYIDIESERAFEDEAGEDDGGVALAIGGEDPNVRQRDAREDADGEGWAVAPDHSHGKERGFGGRAEGVDD